MTGAGRLWLKPYILCSNGRLAIREAALSPWQGTERKVLNLKSPKQWEEQEASRGCRLSKKANLRHERTARHLQR